MSKTTRRVTAAKRTLLVEIGSHRIQAGEWPRASQAVERLAETNDAGMSAGWDYLRELDEAGHLQSQDGDLAGSTVYVLTESGLDEIQSRRPDLVNELQANPEYEVSHDE